MSQSMYTCKAAAEMSGDEIPAAQPEPAMDFEVEEASAAHAEAQETSFAVKELQSQTF